MSEPVRLAKLAREHLASALNTLQSEDNIPDELMDTADPIAEAMSLLHRIERAGGAVLEGRTEALKKIRSSLNQLLGLTGSHPAIEKVMESVALALTKVASLVRYTPPPGGFVAANVGAPELPGMPAAFERASEPAPLRSAEPQRPPEPAPTAMPFAPAPPAMPVVPEPAPMPVIPSPVAMPIAAAPMPAAAAPMPAIAAPTPAMTAPAPLAAAPMPVMSAPAPVVAPSPPVVATPAPVVAPSPPVVATPTPVVAAPEPAVVAPEPAVVAPKPVVSAPAPVAVVPAPAVIAPAPAVIAPAPVVNAQPRVVIAPEALVPPQIPAASPPVSNLDASQAHRSEPSAVPAASPPPERSPTRDELARAAPKPAAAERRASDPGLKRDPGPRPAPGVPKIDVELGTNSASNFYRGLGGNDVVEFGGIFVATYKIPKLGSTVHLRVLLPGNYEFSANAEVRWTRGSGVSVDSAEPGFGARFTQISHEGRQLVFRYAKNREPIFYDDL
jgi:hypothetical protein